MAVQVIFFTPKGIRSTDAPGVGSIRVREAVTIPGTTAAVVQEGECVVVFNGEASGVLVAHGTTPDATATAETAATSCGFPVAAGQVSAPIMPSKSSKISVKAVP